MAFAASLRDITPAPTEQLDEVSRAIRREAERHARTAHRVIIDTAKAGERAKVVATNTDRVTDSIDAGPGAEVIRTAEQAVEFLRRR
jgi:hypothetical protein